MLAVIRETHGDPPALDTAVSRQILDEIATGERPDTLRVHVPPRVVAFGRRDVKAAGYPAAVAATRAAGFSPVERLAGGRAAVFTEGTIAFAWAQAIPDPRLAIRERFELIAAVIQDALVSLGVDAHIGEVAGEYCPGEYSVNAGGTLKIAGVGQRLVRGAAHVGGVIVVHDSQLVKAALEPVYRALDLAWDVGTAGAIDDVVPDITIEATTRAFLEQFSRRYELEPTSLGRSTLDAAGARVRDHQPHATGNGSR